jgi:hypothetical protein
LPIQRPAGLVLGATLGTAAALKLSPFDRDYAEKTALAELLPRRLRPHVRRVWLGITGVEGVVAAGLLADRRMATLFAPVLTAGSVIYTHLASRRVPERPCGCMGAISREPARFGQVRATVLLALSVVGCRVKRTAPDRRAQPPASSLMPVTTGLLAVVAVLSPETRAIKRWWLRRRLERQLNDSRSVLRALPKSTAWRTLSPFIAPGAEPTHWREEDSHYVAYPAAGATRASSVAFMAYQAHGVELGFRGVLLREETREVLIRV